MPNSPKTDLEADLYFLQTCSRISLGDFFLRRLERDNRLRKQIAGLLDQAIDNLALVRLAQIVRDHPDLFRSDPAPILQKLN